MKRADLNYKPHLSQLRIVELQPGHLATFDQMRNSGPYFDKEAPQMA